MANLSLDKLVVIFETLLVLLFSFMSFPTSEMFQSGVLFLVVFLV